MDERKGRPGAASATQVGCMRVRRRQTPLPEEPQIQWVEEEPSSPGDRWLRNGAAAAAVLLCAVALRSGMLPGVQGAADVVMTAVRDDSLLDEQLGRLSFVSTLFPEAVLVFGEDRVQLTAPEGEVVHTWSAQEPYVAWNSAQSRVLASAPGEVTGIAHANGGERLVQVTGADGLQCIYGNLQQVLVQEGQSVKTGDLLGKLLPGAECVMEVRRDGMSVDPMLLMGR